MRNPILLLLAIFALSGSSIAVADGHRCAAGTHWDSGKRECVSDTPGA